VIRIRTWVIDANAISREPWESDGTQTRQLYTVQQQSGPAAKRNILKVTSTVFDPLGCREHRTEKKLHT